MTTQIPKRKDMIGQRYVNSRTFQTLYLGGRKPYYPRINYGPKPKYFWWLQIRYHKVLDSYTGFDLNHANTPTFKRVDEL